ncbi:Vta1 like-domain-containing protein, partial [Flagelloscypha sp. PMI_526]
MVLLGLPAIPADLRAIQPYLQRADELKAKDPVMAYWCAYYAAQVGISLKSKDPAGRELLFTLITKLEQMKAEASPSDAIEQEAASSAYVENFALKVFAMADNEDRRGEGTRSTAKKFLAAANFLEVLKIFPTSELSETNDDKIRYAKWKAADIAKAFREGRKPVPGPAGGALNEELTPQPPPDISLPSPPIAATDISTPDPGLPADSKSHHRRRSSASPPKGLVLDNNALSPDSLPATPPRKPTSGTLGVTGYWGADLDPNSPAAWSTAATPGTTPHPTPGHQTEFIHPEQESPSKRSKRRKDNGSDGSDGSDSSSGSLKPTPSAPPLQAYPNTSLSPSGSSPPQIYANTPSPPQYNAPVANTSPQIYAPPPLAPTASSQPPQIYAPTIPPAYTPSTQPQIYAKAPSPPQVSRPPIELTAGMITQAQKHCRFAISSLDYEDADEARRQLRLALKILDG